jgi:predicted glycoside hydrolase/deacetylase ChbG (UPF0249 family)
MVGAARRLIVNADDLGRTPGINRGIIEAHGRGIVTSATLMVNHVAALEAAALARQSPRLGVGLHVALTGGASALAPAEIPTIVDGQGRLPSKPEGLASADPAEILAEARAQLARFQELVGRLPTHFDSHHHAHRLPAVFDALLALARETGRPVRNASAEMGERLRREGVATTDHFVEAFYGEDATLDRLRGILEALPPGTTELMCHPAFVDEELRAGSGYAEPRARELQVLTDDRVRRALEEAGIRLIHFGEL